jgi:hypothetical protein
LFCAAALKIRATGSFSLHETVFFLRMNSRIDENIGVVEMTVIYSLNVGAAT